MKHGLTTIRYRLLALWMIVIVGSSALTVLAAVQTSQQTRQQNREQTREQNREQNRAEFHESYPLAPDGIVSVSNNSGSGNIHVTSWNENRVQVDAVKRGRRGEDLNLIEIQVNARPERVEIQTIYPRRGGTYSVSVDYELKVPRSAILNSLQSASGNISVQGAVARVVAGSGSGQVTVQNVTGDARLTTGSGNITVDQVGGVVTIGTGSGNLLISNVGGQLNAGGGSANIQATQIKGDARTETSSGYVKLEHVGGRATASSSSGSVTVRDVSGDVVANNVSETVLVDGVRGRVTATSISGRIVVRDVREGVVARSFSSSVEVSNVKGRVEADTNNGSILLREIDSREVKASTQSGNVRFQGKIYSDGRYGFSSFSGDIVLTMPAGSGFTITARTSTGDVETDFPLQFKPGTTTVRPRRIEGTHGDGGAQINITGLSGTIYLKKQ